MLFSNKRDLLGAIDLVSLKVPTGTDFTRCGLLKIKEIEVIHY